MKAGWWHALFALRDLAEAITIISDNALPLLTENNFQTPPLIWTSRLLMFRLSVGPPPAANDFTAASKISGGPHYVTLVPNLAAVLKMENPDLLLKKISCVRQIFFVEQESTLQETVINI